MSRDFEIIRAEALNRDYLKQAIKAAGLDFSLSQFEMDFEIVARAANGDPTARFSALSRLVRRFGR